MDNQSLSENTEINILDLLYPIWKQKLLILIICVIAIMINSIHYFYSDRNYDVEIEVSPISTDQEKIYEQLNMILLKLDNLFSINQKSLLSTLSDRLILRLDMIKLIKENEIINKADFNTLEEYEDQVVDFAYSIEILPPMFEERMSITKENYKPSITINYIGPNKDRIIELIQETIYEANDEVRASLVEQIKNLSISHDLKNKISIEDIESKINAEKNAFNLSIDSKLRHLEEQRQIALFLGIADISNETSLIVMGNDDANNISTHSYIVNNRIGSQTNYLMGHKFIEKQIEILNNRLKSEPLTKEIIDLEVNKLILEQDNITKHINIALSETPLTSGNFLSAKLKIKGSVNVHALENYPLVVIYGGLIGIILSLILIYLREVNTFYRKKTIN